MNFLFGRSGFSAASGSALFIVAGIKPAFTDCLGGAQLLRLSFVAGIKPAVTDCLGVSRLLRLSIV